MSARLNDANSLSSGQWGCDDWAHALTNSKQTHTHTHTQNTVTL